MSPEHPEGLLLKECTSKLYLERFWVNCEVYYRVCMGEKKCVKRWDGENDCIFRVSRKVCLGWEMGYDYVNEVCDKTIFTHQFPSRR